MIKTCVCAHACVRVCVCPCGRQMRAPDALKLKLQVINCIHPDVGAGNGTVRITMLFNPQAVSPVPGLANLILRFCHQKMDICMFLSRSCMLAFA